MSRTMMIAAGLGVALTASAAFGQDAASVEKARHDYFHSIGKPAKGIKEALGSGTPSLADIQKYAAAIDAAAPNLLAQFPADSRPSAGIKTEVRAEVWTKPAEFKAAADKFAAAAHTLNLTAQKGDLAAVGPAFAAMGGTCKSCHESFRKEDH